MQYWPLKHECGKSGVNMELRASLAWKLIEHFGLVSATRGSEDSAGRAAIDLLPIDQVVSRAFAIVDCFVAEAESRGELRPFTSADADQAFRRGGELESIKSDVKVDSWRKVSKPAEPDSVTPGQVV